MTIAAWHNVTVDLSGTPRLVGLNAELRPGTITTLIGPNGAGKTTAIQALAGLVTPASGTISQPVAATPALAYLPQARQLAWDLSGVDVVAIGLTAGRKLYAELDEENQARVQTGLERADAGHLGGRIVRELSGGEQARIHLARLFASPAPLLILDEPLAGLDPAQQLGILDQLRREADEGRTLVLALHDLAAAETLSDRILVLDKGRCVADAEPAQIDMTVLAETFGLKRATGTVFERLN